MTKFFVTHGLPLSIRTDNAANFMSETFKSFLREHGIIHHRNTPLWPQANGEVERQNRSLMKRIRISHSSGRDWKSDLQSYLLAYRSTPNTTTGVSPAELLFRRKIRTKIPDLQQLNADDIEVRDRDSENKGKGKLYADTKRRAVESTIEVGDKVLVKQDRENKFSTPFNPKPYTVVDKAGNSIGIEYLAGSQYKRNVTHVKEFREKHGKGPGFNRLAEMESELSLSDDDFVINDGAIDLEQSQLPTCSKSPAKSCDTPSTPSLALTRPTRVRKMPDKYKDYVN